MPDAPKTDSQTREARLDDTIDDSFPASDPPSNTPQTGTLTSKDTANALSHGHGHDTPKGLPSSDRHATETAAGMVEGVDQAETHDPTG